MDFKSRFLLGFVEAAWTVESDRVQRMLGVNVEFHVAHSRCRVFAVETLEYPKGGSTDDGPVVFRGDLFDSV